MHLLFRNENRKNIDNEKSHFIFMVSLVTRININDQKRYQNICTYLNIVIVILSCLDIFVFKRVPI